MFRRRESRSQRKRTFGRTAMKVQNRNLMGRPMRGGIRL